MFFSDWRPGGFREERPRTLLMSKIDPSMAWAVVTFKACGANFGCGCFLGRYAVQVPKNYLPNHFPVSSWFVRTYLLKNPIVAQQR